MHLDKSWINISYSPSPGLSKKTLTKTHLCQNEIENQHVEHRKQRVAKKLFSNASSIRRPKSEKWAWRARSTQIAAENHENNVAKVMIWFGSGKLVNMICLKTLSSKIINFVKQPKGFGQLHDSFSRVANKITICYFYRSLNDNTASQSSLNGSQYDWHEFLGFGWKFFGKWNVKHPQTKLKTQMDNCNTISLAILPFRK